MDWVSTCQSAKHKGLVWWFNTRIFSCDKKHFRVTEWTHQWVWLWEEPCLLVRPVRSGPKPTGSELSLWSCGLELCTGSSWRVVGWGWHQKIQGALWTRWKPAAPPLFLLDACEKINDNFLKNLSRLLFNLLSKTDSHVELKPLKLYLRYFE